MQHENNSALVGYSTMGGGYMRHLKHVAIVQIGGFSLGQRLATVLYRGAQFFSVGFASSAVGHGLTKWSVSSAALPSLSSKHATSLKCT